MNGNRRRTREGRGRRSRLRLPLRTALRRASGILLAGIFLTHVTVAATEPRAEITSIADWPCAEWAARRTAGKKLDPPQMWLVGFMTGMATSYRIDVLSITDAPSIFTWIDGYCESNSAETLSTGAQALSRC